MDDLLSQNSIGGGSLMGRASEKVMDKKVGKDTMCPDLSFKQRFAGFLICFVLGVLFVMLALYTLKHASGGGDFNIFRFVVPYVTGVVLSFAGTFFLMGFKNQTKKMFDEKRRITTIVLLVAIGLTLLSAFATKNPLLVFICLAVQFVALFWYVIILIPGLRSCLCFCCKKAMQEAAE